MYLCNILLYVDYCIVCCRMGSEGRPRMMTIGLHGRIIGRPGRIGALLRLLDHIQGHDAVGVRSHADRAPLDGASSSNLTRDEHLQISSEGERCESHVSCASTKRPGDRYRMALRRRCRDWISRACP